MVRVESSYATNHTHVLGILQRTVEFGTKFPAVLRSVQCDNPEGLLLGTTPEVPVASVRIVIEESGVATVLIILVLLRDGVEVPVRVDIRREDL
jgi:hypothetical protein